MRKLKVFISVLLVVLVFVSIVACSKSTPTPTTATKSATATTSAAPTTSAAQKPVYGGTLRVGPSNSQQNGIGYPAAEVTDIDYRHSIPCVEALGYYDAAGNVVPYLATGWKEDPAAKTITITIRKGIKFHDGTDFNADAVKWNFQQFIDAKRSEVSNLASVDVIDDSTVRLNFSAWNNGFISQLPFNSQMISPTAFQKNGGKVWALTHPVGTGPFKFVSWETDVKIRYEKFDGYWQAGKPYLDAIEFYKIADPTVAYASFQRHEIDVLENLHDQPNEYLDLKASGKYTTVASSVIGAAPTGVVGDSAHPDSPFANIKVRQAVCYAINKKDIVDNVLHGVAVTCNQYGQPGYWGYNDAVKGFEYNPDKAKSLLAEAGYATGFKTTMIEGNPTDWFTAVQSYLKVVGIDATIDVAGARWQDAIQKTGWTGLCYMSLKGGADISPYMPATFSKTGFIWANSILHNDEMDKACSDMATATDFATKQKFVQNAQQLIFDKYCFLAPVYQSVKAYAEYPNVHGDKLFQIDDFQWTPAETWISK
jgi:peptide/nickel transport system substrate-binding protein